MTGVSPTVFSTDVAEWWLVRVSVWNTSTVRREVGLEGIGSRTVQYGAESVKCGWQTVRARTSRSPSTFVGSLARGPGRAR